MTRPRELLLVAAGSLEGEEELRAWLGGELSARFGAPVRAGEPLRLREEWRGGRGRYDSNRIVDALIDRDGDPRGDPPDRWTLALTDADLFAPGREFVFGEAAQGGAWAVVGLARLRPSPEAADPDALLRRRVLTEAVHELGHVAGLEHCERPDCVMFPSVTLEDSDRKGPLFCPACAARAGLRRP